MYLGHCFQADGDAEHSVLVRMAKARDRFTKLHEVWKCRILSLEVKQSLYQHAVVSVLLHGSEAWDLTPELQAKLNGWNARCVSTFSGRHTRHEASSRYRSTFDLVSHLRVRRLEWVCRVLRMDDGRFHREALKLLFEKRMAGQLHRKGSVLMDVPKYV